MEVTATNGAGLTGSANGPPVEILDDQDGLTTVGITFITAAGIIVVVLSIFLIGYLFFRRRCAHPELLSSLQLPALEFKNLALGMPALFWDPAQELQWADSNSNTTKAHHQNTNCGQGLCEL